MTARKRRRRWPLFAACAAVGVAIGWHWGGREQRKQALPVPGMPR
jgi:hypothetical protein